nr:hypothetical protein Iba_chr09aCG9890 [Ipomoea batatas]
MDADNEDAALEEKQGMDMVHMDVDGLAKSSDVDGVGSWVPKFTVKELSDRTSTSNLLKLEKLISDMAPTKEFEETSKHLRLERWPMLLPIKFPLKVLLPIAKISKDNIVDMSGSEPESKDKCCRKVEELMCKSDDGGLGRRQEDRLSVLSKESFEIE